MSDASHFLRSACPSRRRIFVGCLLLYSLCIQAQIPPIPIKQNSLASWQANTSWLESEISERLHLGLLSEAESERLRASYQELLLHPLDINRASEEELLQLPFLSDYQAYQLLSYRTDHGGFHTVSELKLVRGWTVALLQHLRPLLSCTTEKHRLSWQESSLRSRSTILLLYGRQTKRSGWVGTPDQGRLQLSLDYPERLHLFLAGEKDAGEPWQVARKPSFDAYNATAELPFAQGKLLLGDYRISRGCGLVLGQGIFPLTFQSLAPRLAEGIRPIRHTTETNFSRGVAGELRGKGWELGAFGSILPIDAHRYEARRLTGLAFTGLHRTAQEQALRYQGKTRYVGAWLGILPHPTLRLSFQLIYQDWAGDHLRTPPGSHRQVSLQDLSRYTAGSFSYRWTGSHGKVQLQGELARTDHHAWALTQHIALQQYPWGDLHLALWHVGSDYWTALGRAGTHSLQPNDEQGGRLQYQFTPTRYLGTTLLFVDGYRSQSKAKDGDPLRHGWSWGILTSLQLKYDDQLSLSYRLRTSEQTEQTHRLRAQYSFERRGWQSRLSLLYSRPRQGYGWGVLAGTMGEPWRGLELRILAGYFHAPTWSSRLYTTLPQLTSEYGSLLLYGRGELLALRLRYRPTPRWSIALRASHIAQHRDAPSISSGALELVYHSL